MGDVDDFARDGVFGKHRHRQFFHGGETVAEREQWLREVDEICKTASTAYVVREVTDENGDPGYAFGFADVGAYAAFVFNIYGDLAEPGGHIQTHQFGGESREHREAFLLAAEAHLGALGLKHQWREHDGSLQFAFNRFSDRLMFQALIDQGAIDASAKAMLTVRTMQSRLGLQISDPLHDPDFDLR